MKVTLGSDAPSFVSLSDTNLVINPSEEEGNFTFSIDVNFENENE